MQIEKKLQTDIIKWLKIQGFYVIKTRVGPGVPVGCPDIIALYGEKWLAIEVKASPNAKFQTGQQATLHYLKKWTKFVYVAHPDNWNDIKQEIIAGLL